MGYAGIFSLAHALFFGVGAYTAAWVAMHFSNDFFLCVTAAGLTTALLSLALALPALRVRGEYFVAASLGLKTTSSVVKSIFLVIVLDGFFAMFFAAIGM